MLGLLVFLAVVLVAYAVLWMLNEATGWWWDIDPGDDGLPWEPEEDEDLEMAA